MNIKNNHIKLCYRVLIALLLINYHRTPEFNPIEESELSSIAIEESMPPVITIEEFVLSTMSNEGDIGTQEKIMLTFAKAYPDKINSVEYINNDWTMLVNGTRFYYAQGRFLPEELREQWEEYQQYDFYVYPWTGTARQRQAAVDDPVYSIGSPFLFDALYFTSTEDESWDWQIKYSFLGVKMLIHPHIKPLLDKMEEYIIIVAQTDQSISEWIAELMTSPPTSGWNWRTIVNTNRRSFHSYGTAVDLLPRNLNGRQTFWQWNLGNTIDQKTYYMPPEAVIKVFEDYGFVWGGKWDLIDTMHFEYRPEILLLNDFSVYVGVKK